MTDLVSVERVIPAPPEAIFALLADPSRHPEIDGSGTVKRAATSGRLKLGDTFTMAMKLGIPYRMVNTVVEFEDNRRIAWEPRIKGPLRKLGGRVWRYELEPVEAGTRVRETWDISNETLKPLMGNQREKTRRNMEQTLERIEQLVQTTRQ
jgi:uncharacterized protein YndB with AHSA1/START domain